MSLFVLDTDVTSLYWEGHALVRQRVDACPPDDLAITVITVEEQLTGWYTLTRQARRPEDVARAYARLAEAVGFLGGFRILPYTEHAIARVDGLKAMRLNVRVMDLRIAAIALENGATVVTGNLRDFQRVPSLPVENWAV
ncbi:MAG TPA: type II toxin-antitoxin system VapC family toxin [Gemmataceae bacterium]|nr:type II toxin-antitoxin system VapC family toxin [Gemmataceae bacterium]